MPNIAIIGSLYGDEGKGRTVDYFAKQYAKLANDSIVVRFSGSNDASHTVVLDENTKHVFHTMGAGSFRNIPTYLSKHVVVDLISLVNEIEDFKTKFPEYNAGVYIDPRCKICLPYDVVLNRIKENILGGKKHGSTGNGLNECIKRSDFININLYHRSSLSVDDIEKVRLYYLDELISIFRGVDKSNIDPGLMELADFLSTKESSKFVYEKILEARSYYLIKIQRVNLKKYNIIFEGSQGLLLDEYSKHYPHVTRTRTGSTNIIDICREFDIKVDDIYYIARPYFNRHGIDIYFKDNSEYVLSEYNIVDETNIHNECQDSLYFDFFDFKLYEETVSNDFNEFKKHYPETKDNRVFTCIDQIRNLKPETYKYEEYIQSCINRLENKVRNGVNGNSNINRILFFKSPIN